MDERTGQHANAAIFAANGPARRRLLKAAGAASFGLLAAWLIALALGVWGGFESLPGLPNSDSTRPSEATSRTQDPRAPAPPQSHPQSHQSARAVRTASPSPAGSGSGGGGGGGTTQSQDSNRKATAPQPVQSPSTSSTPPSTSHDTTTTTEVPTDSPGNLPSGSEVPGQLP